MLTQAQIEEQLENDRIQFGDKIYDGFTHESLMSMFKKAMMRIPPGQHGLKMSYIQKLIVKKEDELSFMDVGNMINFIYAMPFNALYETLEEGIENTLIFDNVRADYNKLSQKFEGAQQRKKIKLYEIAGIGKSTPMIQSV